MKVLLDILFAFAFLYPLLMAWTWFLPIYFLCFIGMYYLYELKKASRKLNAFFEYLLILIGVYV